MHSRRSCFVESLEKRTLLAGIPDLDVAKLADVNLTGSSSNPQEFVQINDRIVFFLNYDSDEYVPYSYDPATRTTEQLHPGNNHYSSPRFGGVMFEGLYYHSYNNNGTLWVTDGTAAGTRQLRIGSAAGQLVTNVSSLTVFNESVYLSGSTPATSEELFKTNGTHESTLLVKDIYPGNQGSRPQSMRVVDETLFFSCITQGAGRELWKSDGTANGTVMVTEIRVGNPSGIANDAPNASISGKYIFVADDGVFGDEVWVSDGTASGTQVLVNAGPGSLDSDPGGFGILNNNLYFKTQYGSYKTNGTPAGTLPFAGDVGRRWNNVTQLDDHTLIYQAESANHVYVLYDDQPEMSGLLREPGDFFSLNSVGYRVVDGEVLISTSDWDLPYVRFIRGQRETQSFGLTMPNLFGFNWKLLRFGVVNDEVFVTGVNAANKVAIYRIDPTGATAPVETDILADGKIGWIESVNNRLFLAADNEFIGFELYDSDATAAGTQLVTDFIPGSESSYPELFVAGEKSAYFRAWDGVASHFYHVDLASDVVTAAFPTDGLGYDFDDLSVINGRLIFRSRHNDSSVLWSYDPVTDQLSQIDSHPISSGIHWLVEMKGDKSSFQLYQSFAGLLKTDGTVAGTTYLTGIPSAVLSSLEGFTNSGGVFYFSRVVNPENHELWKTDFTAAGTTMLRSEPSEKIYSIHNVNERTIFMVIREGEYSSLWTTDGTPAGTTSFYSTDTVTAPSIFPDPVNDRIFFYSSDPNHGLELWVSDFTNWGTHLAIDMIPGAAGQNDQDWWSFRGSIYQDHLLFYSRTSASSGTYGFYALAPDLSGAHLILNDVSVGSLATFSGGGQLLIRVNDIDNGDRFFRIVDPTDVPVVINHPNTTTPLILRPNQNEAGAYGTLVFGASDGFGEEPYRIRDVIRPTLLRVDRNPADNDLIGRAIFSEALDASITSNDLQLTNRITGQVIDGSDFDVQFNSNQQALIVRYTESANGLPDGRWRLTIPSGAIHDQIGNASDGDFIHDFNILRGDVNSDGFVNFNDLLIIAQNYGVDERSFDQGNLDGDDEGKVDFADLLIVAQSYLHSLPPLLWTRSAIASKRQPMMSDVFASKMPIID